MAGARLTAEPPLLDMLLTRVNRLIGGTLRYADAADAGRRRVFPFSRQRKSRRPG